jgi:hypothetical protein
MISAGLAEQIREFRRLPEVMQHELGRLHAPYGLPNR